MAINTWMGRADRTNLTQTARPAKFIREAFQPGNLSPTFSIQGKRFYLLNFLSEMDNPKYVHGNSAVVQVMEEVITDISG